MDRREPGRNAEENGGGRPVPESPYAIFARRTRKYQDLGYDREAAARFVAGLTRPGDGPALDVGTGKGILAISLAEHFPDVVSIDVSTEDSELAVLLADEAGVRSRIRFLTCDASRVPFPDGHFGCVAMMDVLHHLAEGASVLEEVRRALRPGGIFVVADFTEGGFDLVARVHREDGRVHPVGPVTLDWVSNWFQERGFVKLSEATDHLQHAIVLSKGNTL
jgi:ubiquinone/menaquinone biosynthesis C-methylase UbiE